MKVTFKRSDLRKESRSKPGHSIGIADIKQPMSMLTALQSRAHSIDFIDRDKEVYSLKTTRSE